MVDTTDLVVAVSVVQTLVLIFTLVIFIFQFRSQERALREATYQNVMGRYTDTVRMMVDKPELNRLITDLGTPDAEGEKPGTEITQEERTVMAFMLVMFGILEECYVLYCKGWIDKDSWDQWGTLLETMSEHPLFLRVVRGSKGTLDQRFERYVDEMVGKKAAGSK